MKQRSYTATGINLKAMAMGESDRLVTVLTREKGLIRAIAPGARKHKSRLGGRSGLFVVNECFFTKGKSLDKLVQAETVQSFPGLSKNLAKLTASQYLAEIALSQALSDQPQDELYYLLIEHLSRIESASKSNILPCLAQATFHLLALAGVAPEVFRCCLSRQPLDVELGNPEWKVGFSVSSGGAIALNEIERLEGDRLKQIERLEEDRLARLGQLPTNTAPLATTPLQARAAEAGASYLSAPVSAGSKHKLSRPTFITPNKTYSTGPNTGIHAKIAKEVAHELGLVGYLSAAELALLQQLSKPQLVMSSTKAPAAARITHYEGRHRYSQSGTIEPGMTSTVAGRTESPHLEAGPHLMWRHIEKFLRHYAQYQLDRPIRSADLIDTCFNP